MKGQKPGTTRWGEKWVGKDDDGERYFLPKKKKEAMLRQRGLLLPIQPGLFVQ